jgi:hypothetical protein
MTSKIAMVHIPKTAGGSIKNWIKNNNLSDQFCFSGHDRLVDFPLDYTISFTVVRNPYSRLISAYVWSKYDIKRQINKGLKKKSEIRKNWLLYQNDVIENGIIYWLDWLQEVNLEIGYSQLKWSEGVDIILKQENLLQDFIQIQNIVNCHEPLPNSYHKMTYSKENYITDKFVETVNKYYNKEFEILSYAKL